MSIATVIGAGSAMFTQNIVTDVLTIPVLVDMDEHRVALAREFVDRVSGGRRR